MGGGPRGGAGGGAAAGGGALGGYTFTTVPLPYPYERVFCPRCSGVVTPSGPSLAANIIVYSVSSAAHVARQSVGTCASCSEVVPLHPVEHLSIDYCVGSLTAPRAVFSRAFIDLYHAVVGVKPSMGVNSMIKLWERLTLSARASGVPLPHAPRNATLRVAALESDISRVLQRTEAGTFASCPCCSEVVKGGAGDGCFKGVCHRGPRKGSSAYASAMDSTVSSLSWVPRGLVEEAQASRPAQPSPEGHCCGGAGTEGTHLSSSSGSTTTSKGIYVKSCPHLYVFHGNGFSDLANGEHSSQSAIHAAGFIERVKSQRRARELAECLIARVAPACAEVETGSAHNIFALAREFLDNVDIAAVAPIAQPSPVAAMAWLASPRVGAGGGVVGGRGGAGGSAGSAPAAPPLPAAQGEGHRFWGAAEIAPSSPDAVPFEESFSKFLSRPTTLMRLWPYTPYFTDNMCGLLSYLSREGVLRGNNAGVLLLLNAFHATGHRPQCAPLFGGLFKRGLGSADGEWGERINAILGLLQHPTRVMGPANRGAAFAFFASDYSAARSFDHAEFLRSQCIIAVRRRHHAGVAYAAALRDAERRTGVLASVIHATVPVLIRNVLVRSRDIEDASRGPVAATVLSPDELLRIEHGRLLVYLYVLEGRLAAVAQRDAAFLGADVLKAAIADYELSTAPPVSGSIAGMKAELARVRKDLVDVQKRMKKRSMAIDHAAAAVAYNTSRFHKSVAAVFSLLQRLNKLYMVRCEERERVPHLTRAHAPSQQRAAHARARVLPTLPLLVAYTR